MSRHLRHLLCLLGAATLVAASGCAQPNNGSGGNGGTTTSGGGTAPAAGGAGGSGPSGGGYGGFGGAAGAPLVGGAGGMANGGSGGTSSTGGGGTGGADLCDTVVCDQPPKVCNGPIGVCYNGYCSYPPLDGVPCNHACGVGQCQQGICQPYGPKCLDPPAPVCTNATTRRAYSLGSCDFAAPPGVEPCSYGFTDVPCPDGCVDGQCVAAGCHEEFIDLMGPQSSGVAGITVAPDDNIHVATYPLIGVGEGVYLRSFPGQEWQGEVLPDASDVAHPLSMLVTNAGVVHMTAARHHSMQGWQRSSGGIWALVPIGGWVNQSQERTASRLRMDPNNGHLHVASVHYDSGGLDAVNVSRFENTGNGWSSSGGQLLFNYFLLSTIDYSAPTLTVAPNGSQELFYWVRKVGPAPYDGGGVFRSGHPGIFQTSYFSLIAPSADVDSNSVVHLLSNGEYFQKGPTDTTFTSVGTPGFNGVVYVDNQDHVYVLNGNLLYHRVTEGVWSSKQFPAPATAMDFDSKGNIHAVTADGWYMRLCAW